MRLYWGNGARWYSYFWIKPRLILSFYLCLRLTSPNYAFMMCCLYSNQKVIPYKLFTVITFSCWIIGWLKKLLAAVCGDSSRHQKDTMELQSCLSEGLKKGSFPDSSFVFGNFEQILFYNLLHVYLIGLRYEIGSTRSWN